MWLKIVVSKLCPQKATCLPLPFSPLTAGREAVTLDLEVEPQDSQAALRAEATHL